MLLPLALAAALCAVLPAPAGSNVGPPAGPTQSPPGALVWGSGVFTSRASFGHWLQKRHKTFDRFGALHPRATTILAAAETPPVRFRPSQFAPRESPPPVLTVAKSAGASSFPVSILLVLGLVLVVLAALPFPALAPQLATAAVGYRIALLAVGTTVVAVIAIAKLAG